MWNRRWFCRSRSRSRSWNKRVGCIMITIVVGTDCHFISISISYIHTLFTFHFIIFPYNERERWRCIYFLHFKSSLSIYFPRVSISQYITSVKTLTWKFIHFRFNIIIIIIFSRSFFFGFYIGFDLYNLNMWIYEWGGMGSEGGALSYIYIYIGMY